MPKKITAPVTPNPAAGTTAVIIEIQRQEALLKTGALQNAILNSANFSSIATDAKGVIQIFNVGAERMLGYAAADVMNKITPADISDPLEVIARAKALSVELNTPITPGFEALVFKASRGIEDIYELTYIRKDGSRFPAVVSVTALRDAQNTIIGYLLIGTDNTARKQAEAALLKAGALQSAIFNSANFSSIATDAKGVIQIFNVGAERMLGYAAADVMNKITPADISDPQEVIARAKALSVELNTPITPGFEALVFKASRGIEDIYELTYIRKDGSRFPAVVSVTALRDAQNTIIGYLLIGTDNTARKQAEAALLKAGALQSAIFNSANFSSIATDAKGVIQIFNVGAERMLGYAAADVMNKITPADISDPQEVIARAKALSIELGTPITPGFEALVFKASRGIEDIYELTYIRKDGSRFPAVVSVTALRDAQNAIIGYLLIGTDNTARKQVEAEQKVLDQRLRDQQFYTRSLIEFNIDAIMTTDPSGIISDVNKQMEALTGSTRDELIGAPFKNYFTDPERAEAAIKLVLHKKKVTDYELTARARDGKETVVSYNATTFYDRDRRLQGVFAAARDITERKRLDQVLLDKNTQLEGAKSLEEKAEQLALASKYKSQFLANMSHELRTPLNSMLILAQILGDNGSANLTDKQVRSAKTIFAAGNDLLALINDILDLSKIEAGMVSIEVGEIGFTTLRDYVERSFRQIADKKGLDLSIDLEPGLPKAIITDAKRLQQVLLNLLANSLKFTEKGKVSLHIGVAKGGWRPGHRTLDAAATVLSFRVTDTGIGIPADKQEIIFEAFQQADMTTSRKYGGTGLGLTISREIAKALGGEIHVKSGEQGGSVFTLFLPASYVPVEQPSPAEEIKPETFPQKIDDSAASAADAVETAQSQEATDDRMDIRPGDKVLLIVEDDPHFAGIMLETARENGFKCLVAERGDAALALAHKMLPDGISLDIKLPDMDGWQILDLLKHDPATRHIPVHIVTVEGDEGRLARLGALACLEKPVTKKEICVALASIRDFIDRKVKKLLIVEDNEVQRDAIVDLVGGADIGITAVATGGEALTALHNEKYDCMVLDLGLSDISGFTLLDDIHKDASLRRLPVIVYTGKDLNPKEEARLKKLAKSIIIKDVQSPERLLDATSLYLHRPEAHLAPDKRRIIEKLRLEDPELANMTALIVDDDVRNIFALTSLLEQHKIKTRYSESGKGAIEILQGTPDIDIVLMDIMMPDMDGYETMQAIRKIAKFRRLPIIALTAKAMKGDREKCLEAGASDYISKPVDIPQLLSILRVWSPR